MWVVLFLDLDNLEYYGYIPEIPEDRESRVEIYRFDIPREYWDCFEKDFINIFLIKVKDLNLLYLFYPIYFKNDFK